MPEDDPVQVWRRLRETGGRRVTVIDLYELAAASRGVGVQDLPREERRRLAEIAVSEAWAGFGLLPGTDHPPDPIELVDYDPAWPGRYQRWRNRIADALGATALRIEHVGSTAVPGLPAKPVIDVQVSIASLADESRYAPRLEAAGVRLRSRDDLHRFFRTFPAREAHVHVCEAGGGWEREHLLFRDYLRAHPAARDAYATAKRAAARTWRDDRWAYTEAKTGVILDIFGRAERWARATRWELPRPGQPRGRQDRGD